MLNANTITEVRSRLKGLSRDTIWHVGLNHSVLKNARGARILVYHGICQRDHLRFNTLFLKLKTFESQLRLYKKYFNLVSLDDFYKQRFEDQKFNACLTFDDGLANNFKYVLPLLEKYQVPAAFFITGIRDVGYDILWNDVLCMAYQYGPGKFNFRKEEFVKGRDKKYVSSVSGKKLADILRISGFEEKSEMIELLGSCRHKAEQDYWLQMTVEQIKTISASKLITVGGHGYYHSDLSKIPVASVREEMTRSKNFLESITGKEIKALAFPYGSYSREAVNEAKNAGYSQLLATEFIFPEDGTDKTLRERFTINPFISNINQMHANIAGHYK